MGHYNKHNDCQWVQSSVSWKKLNTLLKQRAIHICTDTSLFLWMAIFVDKICHKCLFLDFKTVSFYIFYISCCCFFHLWQISCVKCFLVIFLHFKNLCVLVVNDILLFKNKLCIDNSPVKGLTFYISVLPKCNKSVPI